MNAVRVILSRALLLFAVVCTGAVAQTGLTPRSEGQHMPDRGDGTFLNPVLAGDHPDPSVLKVNDEYYMTFSSMDQYPGLTLWRSRDLVNWQPIGPALTAFLGSVWAPDLIRHNGRYYIYFPARTPSYRSTHVVWADDIRGPWSAPTDLKVPLIDPGHIVGEDGARYLFFNDGWRVRLTDDGLATNGPLEKVYEGWKYPEAWDVESYSLEGPKLLRHGEYFHLITAVGGTAGPPTGHMVISSRSRSIHGPWEHSPYNPLIRTVSRDERWWSKGHATPVEGPAGGWYAMYHAYENGYWTLGRQTLLEPMRWTADGWFVRAGADVSAPLPMPVNGRAVPHGMRLSDDFSAPQPGPQWSFYQGNGADSGRIVCGGGTLRMQGRGRSPADCSPFTVTPGEKAYRCEVEAEIDSGAQGGLLLFYSKRLYAGLGFNDTGFVLHRYGTERAIPKPSGVRRRLHLRLTNDRHILTLHYSTDGGTWVKFGTQMEVSGYHHNVAYDFLSLRPALYAAGSGTVRFRNFRYQALP